MGSNSSGWILALVLMTPGNGWAQSAGEFIPGGDFEAGLSGWLQFSSASTTPFHVQNTPLGGDGQYAVACDLAAQELARLERRVPLQPGEFVESAPVPGEPGRKLEFGTWVWLDPGSSTGEVWLELESFNGFSATLLTSSIRRDVALLPKARWLFLSSDSGSGAIERLPADCLELRYSLNTDASGLIFFDAVRVRDRDREELTLAEASFEDWVPGTGAWRISGSVSAGPSGPDQGGYYGTGHAILAGSASTSLSQSVELVELVGGFPPIPAGQFVEAGMWLRCEGSAALPSSPDPLVFVHLKVFASRPGGGAERLLAEARFSPTLSQVDHWVFLQTQPWGTAEPGETNLRLEVGRTFEGQVAVDFVQLGEVLSIDGNPRRRVGCSYVGRYRSPAYLDTPEPLTAEGRWRNWHWQTPPACSNSYVGFYHSPDCVGNPTTCVRANGRRDGASSPRSSQHDLPLVGAYDSRDPEIIRYHLALAESAGIDHFIFDYQGHALALQQAALGIDPINERTWQTLVQECEAPSVNMKMAVMYEPKVHFLGWVFGQPSKAAKVAGITQDLIHLTQSMAGSRAALRHDGRLVVFVFRNQICNGSGTQCLEESDWLSIQAAVHAQTGDRLFLVGDTLPGPGSVLQGFTRWQLVQRDLLLHRTWPDVRDGIFTQPSPVLAELEAHALGLHHGVRDWVAQAEDERLGVLTVWPGFDDAGVGGWGQGNLIGEDGLPLCVRVASDFNGAFYSTTVDSALREERDWIQIATWNDWNEATRIEPAYSPNFPPPVLVGGSSSGAVVEQVFGRLLETRQWIEHFKGGPVSGSSFEEIAGEYLSRARRDPSVPLYD